MHLPPDVPDRPTGSRADLGDDYAAAGVGRPTAVWSGSPAPGLLEPGDRRIRAVARPTWRSTHARTSRWTCTRCGDPHRISATWAVVLRDPHSSTPRATMVCAVCADLLMPYRFLVDAGRARDLPRSSSTARAAIELVERVDRARGSDGGSDDGDALCIRSADVVALTSDLAIDRDELADDLLDLGLLVGTSRGTGPVPAAGGRPGR